MSIRTVRICDGCGETLDKTSEAYKLELKTDKFWDGVESDYLTQDLDFCYKCARNIKDTLLKILKRMEGGLSE